MRSFLTASLCVLATTVQTAPARPAVDYTSKTPYVPQQAPAAYSKPPPGFTAVFTEHVARHGSRGLSSRKDSDQAAGLWAAARAAHALTPLGETLGAQLTTLAAANEAIGWGNLSARGKREHREMAARVRQRLPALFAEIAAKSERIEIVSSGEPRAAASGRMFAEGLTAADGRLALLIDPPRVDRDRLYFHKAAANADYQAYVDSDPALLATLKGLHDLPRTHAVARRVLERLFAPAFVDRLAKGDMGVADEVEAALLVYNLLLIGPAMSDEGDWKVERFIRPGDADWLAYLTDAEDFYQKGPAFAGRDITYRMAGVLLEDFLAQAEAKAAGRSRDGAVFRFAHAEEIIPLAALMRLPGSTKPATVAAPYAYASNPWRGAKVSPMAANIQWDLFRNGDRYLVRMLYNEREIPFRAPCRPTAPRSPFYALEELRRCLRG